MKCLIVEVFVLGGLLCFFVFAGVKAVKFDVSRQRSSDGKCTYVIRCLTDLTDTTTKDIANIASMKIVVKHVLAELDIEVPLPLATVKEGHPVLDVPYYSHMRMIVEGTGGIVDKDARLNIVVKTGQNRAAAGRSTVDLPPLYRSREGRGEGEEEIEEEGEEHQCGNEVFICEVEYRTRSGHTDVITVTKATAPSWGSDLGREESKDQGQVGMTKPEMEALVASLLDKLQARLEANIVRDVRKNNDKANASQKEQDRKLDQITTDLETLVSRAQEVSSSTVAALDSVKEEVKTLQKRFSDVEGAVDSLKESIEQQLKSLKSKSDERNVFPTKDCLESSSGIKASVEGLHSKLDKFATSYNLSTQLTNQLITAPRSCKDILSTRPTVVAVLSPGFYVLCDTVSDGGGWIVIQKRFNGNLDMNRTWQEYKDGFGDLHDEFWLGNEKIHLLTSKKPHELLVKLKYKGKYYHARYAVFQVLNEEENYTLRVSNYTGNAGDSLTEVHDGKPFSTYDKDNDSQRNMNCAKFFGSGWWHKRCFQANLNVAWTSLSLTWHTLTAFNSMLDYTEMKIRPYGG